MRTRKQQRIVKIVMVILNILVVITCIAFIIIEYRARRKLSEETDCSPLVYLEGGKLVDSLYSPYTYLRFVFNTLICVWLTVITIMVSNILRTETGDGSLTKESCTIVIIIWGFILSYIGWLVESIVVSFFTQYTSLF